MIKMNEIAKDIESYENSKLTHKKTCISVPDVIILLLNAYKYLIDLIYHPNHISFADSYIAQFSKAVVKLKLSDVVRR